MSSIIQTLLDTRMGFVTDKELPLVIAEDPTQRILVRCGCGRFIACADQVKHFIDIIERDKTDYVRDISIYREV